MKRNVITLGLAFLLAFSFIGAAAAETFEADFVIKSLQKSSITQPEVKLNYDNSLRMALNLYIPPMANTPEDSARLFFLSSQKLFPVSDLDFTHTFVRTLPVIGGNVVRVSQTINGLPVRGGEVVFRMDEKNYIRRIVNSLIPVGPNTVVGEFKLTRHQAMAIAVSEFLGISRKDVVIDDHLETFTIREYIVQGQKATPVYRINVPGPRLIDGRAVYVDAETGEIVASDPLVIHFGQAKAWHSNPGKKGDRELDEVELPHLTSGEEGSFLKGEWMDVYNCLDLGQTVTFQGMTFPLCTESHKAVADADGNYLYDPVMPSTWEEPGSKEDEFAEVHMYYHTNHVYDYFFEMGLSSLVDKPMAAVVNYKLPAAMMGGGGTGLAALDNAAFVLKGGFPVGLNATKDMILFGQGSKVDFSYDADVIYHEFTHAVVNSTARLGFYALDEQGIDMGPFSLNEGYADFFACALSEDSEVGDYVGNALAMYGQGAPSGALRTLANKNTCPKDLWGESHHDGMIWSASLWDIRELYKSQIGGEIMPLDTAAYTALASLSTNADFYQAANATLDEIRGLTGLDFSREAEKIFVERGIIPECERVVELPHMLMFIEGTGSIYLKEIPAPIQFKIPVPEKVGEKAPVGIEFKFIGAGSGGMGGWGGGGAAGELWLIAKRDAPIRFDMKATGFPSDTEWDKIKLTKTAGAQGTSNYTGYITNFCFTPGDYFVMLTNTDRQQYQTAQFSAKVLTELPAEADSVRYNFIGECKSMPSDDDDDDTIGDDDDNDDTTDDDDAAGDDDDNDDTTDDDDDDNDSGSGGDKKGEDEAEDKKDEGCSCRVR